jgi:type IV secretory pathway TrbD component
LALSGSVIVKHTRTNPVFRSLNRPLTIMRAERKLFFFALMMGAGVFNLLKTLFGGILMFFLLYVLARWATKTDPKMLRFLLNSAQTRSEYDPMKLVPFPVLRRKHV